MNYGFEALVSEVPAQRVDIAALVREAGLDDEVLERLYAGGLKRVPVDEEATLVEMVRQAVVRLVERVEGLVHRTHGILFAHSLPVLAPAEMSFLDACLERLHLDAVPRIAVTGQPCSILHMAIRLAGDWLNEAPPHTGILLIGGDKAYSAEERIFFNSAMGDAVVAGFVTRGAAVHRILACVSDTKLFACQGEYSAPERIAQFRSNSPALVRDTVERCLASGGVTLSDLTYIVPHTPYHQMWDTFGTFLRFPLERILTRYLGETGHLNSNDSLVHYVQAVKEGIINSGDLALLINPGFGGTRGCTLILKGPHAGSYSSSSSA